MKFALARHALLDRHARVLVGVSGGTDSITLLHLLRAYCSRYQTGWQIIAAHIDPCFPDQDSRKIQEYFIRSGTEYRIVRANINQRLERTANKCFVCARERHRRLIEVAEEYGIFHIALAHHQDDAVETLLLNMLYAGRMSTLVPKQPVLQARFWYIRPLYYLRKTKIAAIARASGLKPLAAPCPYYRESRREKIRALLDNLSRRNPDIYSNIFRSLFNMRREYMPS